MAQAAARKRATPTPASYSRGRTENVLPALRVLYYQQMRRQRVYQVKVGWQKSKTRPPADAEPIRIRLIMAGAQVVPSEQVLDPADPDASASFYVTPLADGKLRAEHLEVLIQGRKVQELQLPAKVVNQRRTLVLLALSILMPWLINTYLRPPENRQATPLTAKDLHIPQYVTDKVPSLPGIIDTVALNATGLWIELHERTREHPLEVYWAVALGLLTVVSWWSMRSKRKRRVGKPIPLPRTAAEFG